MTKSHGIAIRQGCERRRCWQRRAELRASAIVLVDRVAFMRGLAIATLPFARCVTVACHVALCTILLLRSAALWFEILFPRTLTVTIATGCAFSPALAFAPSTTVARGNDI